MRIAQVCPYSLTLPGGVQAQVMGLTRVLRALGHEARVLGPCDGPPPEPWVTPLGVSIPTASNGSVAPIAPDPSAALRTIRALHDEEFDVVHLHEPLVPGPPLTALIVADVPRLGTFHRAGGSLAYRRLRPVVRRLAKRLDARCAVSEAAAATAAAALGGRYEVLFNGIEVDRFASAEPWPTEGPTILFMGRHEPRKGLAVLLEAMARLPSDVRLWVGSDGPQTRQLQSQYAGDPRIAWLGRIDDAEKARRLRGADVFCAPSLGGESFGVVLLEAMAAGAPVVASDLSGYRTVARAGVDALLVPPGEEEPLAAALCRVLGDPALSAELRSSGERHVAGFAMECLAHRYLELYDGLGSPDGHR
ncbi:MAG TPA: glycosyltransferase family 4 protein [Acidimicrobiales bacterium]|nr:glycosyltransferase family 4 protein [Acidimicrobiales bacterium]